MQTWVLFVLLVLNVMTVISWPMFAGVFLQTFNWEFKKEKPTEQSTRGGSICVLRDAFQGWGYGASKNVKARLLSL